MGTPHINAEKGDFAKVVLMPGDPIRAKWIAETYLHDYKEVTNVRGILGYTGYTRNNKKISVMASGMGMPSIGIYSTELYTGYGVEIIIRVCTCGTYQPYINLKDEHFDYGYNNFKRYCGNKDLISVEYLIDSICELLEEKEDGTRVYIVDGIYNEDAEDGTDFRAVVEKYISVGVVNNIR